MIISFELLLFVLIALVRIKTLEVSISLSCACVCLWFCVPEVGVRGWSRVDRKLGQVNSKVEVHSTRAGEICGESFLAEG